MPAWPGHQLAPGVSEPLRRVRTLSPLAIGSSQVQALAEELAPLLRSTSRDAAAINAALARHQEGKGSMQVHRATGQP